MSREILNYYYYVYNGTLLCDKSILFQSSNNWLSKFMHRYNFTKNKHSHKKVKKFEGSRIICQRFHSYFYHIFCTNNCLGGGGGVAPPTEDQKYRVSFPKHLLRLWCLVALCLGGESSRTNLLIHFAHRHVQDKIVILEEGSRP